MMLDSGSQNAQASIFHPISQQAAREINADQLHAHSAFYLNYNRLSPVYLTLTENYLLLSHHPRTDYESSQYVRLDFFLKFEVLYQGSTLQSTAPFSVHSKSIGFRLSQKDAEDLAFEALDANVLGLWVNLLGKRINQLGFHQLFKPIKKLGKGGFATVYEVERVTDGCKFAVKAFSKTTTINSSNPSHRLTLLNEIKLMRGLSHPNVIKLEGVFQSDNSLYVILEELSGGQMHSKINSRAGKFSPKEVKEFMRGLCRGLKELHSHNIMHRDIKPDNLMLRDDGTMEPVIVDFGLAADVNSDDYIFYRCGTPGYVAPEVITLARGQKIAPTCDIFSAGAIFHILLMARPLFTGSKFEEVYENNRKLNFNLRSEDYAHVDREAIDLLEKMLKVDPKERLDADGVLRHAYLARDAMLEEKMEQMSSVTSAERNARKNNIFDV